LLTQFVLKPEYAYKVAASRAVNKILKNHLQQKQIVKLKYK